VCRELVLREMHPKAKKKAELPAGGLEAPAVATQEVEVQPEGAVYMKNGVWLDADGNEVS
jgi:hypothetical protein